MNIHHQQKECPFLSQASGAMGRFGLISRLRCVWTWLQFQVELGDHWFQMSPFNSSLGLSPGETPEVSGPVPLPAWPPGGAVCLTAHLPFWTGPGELSALAPRLQSAVGC